MQALEITNLNKTYSNGTVALKNIDLSVAAGDFFGFLGENGAGKSTTIGIIASLILKTTGSVKVFGYDIDEHLTQVKRCIGLVPQEMNFNIFEKVIDVLINQAGYYGVPESIAQTRAAFYLKKLGLWNQRYTKGMHLSGGMKRRLMIVRALLHLNYAKECPSLLILDEPTAGVDVELRKIIWDFLKELNEQGTTIILTTHYLEEAEHLCKNVAIIDQGRIIEKNSMQELVGRLSRQIFMCDLTKELITLPKIDGFTLRLIGSKQIEVGFQSNQTINQLFAFFNENNIEIASFYPKSNRLESVFLDLIKS